MKQHRLKWRKGTDIVIQTEVDNVHKR